MCAYPHSDMQRNHRTAHQRGLVKTTRYPNPNGTPGRKRNYLLARQGYRCAHPLCKLPSHVLLDPDDLIPNVHPEGNHDPPLHLRPINKQNASPNQILCKQCHKNKTAAERTALAAQRAANRAATTANGWQSKKRTLLEADAAAKAAAKAVAKAVAKANQKKRHNDTISAQRRNREYDQKVAKRQKLAARHRFQARR